MDRDEETGTCSWSGKYVDTDGDGAPDEEDDTDDAKSGDDNLMLYLGGGIGLALVVLLSLFFVLRGGNEDEIIDSGMSGDFSATAGYAGVEQMDPMEQYVQQLIAQGYPESCSGLCSTICWAFPTAAIVNGNTFHLISRRMM